MLIIFEIGIFLREEFLEASCAGWGGGARGLFVQSLLIFPLLLGILSFLGTSFLVFIISPVSLQQQARMARLSIRMDYLHVVQDAVACISILPTLTSCHLLLDTQDTQDAVILSWESTSKTDVPYCATMLSAYGTTLLPCCVRCVQERCPDVVVVAVDPVGSILALPDHLNDQDRLCPYKVCVSAPHPPKSAWM